MARMHHLDALRSFCMLYGVFYHAHVIASFWLSDLVVTASGYFRMSTFFFVSALLTAMLFDRRGASSVLQARLVALGVPLVVSFFTLVPLARWGEFSIALLPEGPASLPHVLWGMITFQLSGVYLHLWFLIVLILYLVSAPAACILLRRILRSTWVHALTRRIPRSMQLAVIAIIVGAGCATSISIFHAVLPTTGVVA